MTDPASMGGVSAILYRTTGNSTNHVAGLEQCPGLCIQPFFPAVGSALTVTGFLQFGRATQPLGNVTIVDQGATAPTILVPIGGTVQQGFLVCGACIKFLIFGEVFEKFQSIRLFPVVPCAAGLLVFNGLSQFFDCHL